MKFLIVVDCQNDFIDGVLGTPEALDMIPRLEKKLELLDNETHVIFTRDTHYEDYEITLEGKKLPIRHCIWDTEGWNIPENLTKFFNNSPVIVDKPTFGSFDLIDTIERFVDRLSDIEEIELVGICTDICVVSNALLLRAALPETEISVDSTCCAGTSPENHEAALKTMANCQINIK